MTFILWALSVIATWALARHNGRKEGWAVFMGVLFGFIALIVYLMIGKSFEKKLDEASRMAKAMQGNLQ